MVECSKLKCNVTSSNWEKKKAFKEQEDIYSTYRARFHGQSVFFCYPTRTWKEVYVIKYIRGENVRGLKYDNSSWV